MASSRHQACEGILATPLFDQARPEWGGCIPQVALFSSLPISPAPGPARRQGIAFQQGARLGISFLLLLLLLVVGLAIGHLVVLPLLGDTWDGVLEVVVIVVVYFSWEFLHRRLATFLMGEALASQEKSADHNET